MNPEIKAKWVAALRSGEYKQGTNRLKMADRFCCLGVLCDLHSKETGQQWVDMPGAQGAWYYRQCGLPAFTVVEWAGLDSCDPAPEGYDPLSVLNDQGRTFAEIADLIEKHL